MALTENPRTYNVDQFGIILVTTSDIHGVSRGRFVFRESVPGVVTNGLGMTQAALFGGILCDVPISLSDYRDSGWTNGTTVPDLATLKPMSWLSYGGRRVGHLLCDFLDSSREPETSSSRELALQQIRALKDLGYKILTSLDLEFTIFNKDTLTPVESHENVFKLILTLLTTLPESGLQVVSVRQGMDPGKLLISLEAQPGIAAPDSIIQLRNALKSLCAREGYDISWMTRPVSGVSGNRNNYTITLQTVDGRNVFADANSEEKISVEARHWMAGLLHHGGAIEALVRPTLNCYNVEESWSIIQNSWTIDQLDRTSRLNIQMNSYSVSIKDRLPSSASNPYIVMAALIAAGIDGLVNKLQLSGRGKPALHLQSTIPNSLQEALFLLEEDKVLCDLIGNKFVYRFLLLKREFEVGRLEKRKIENNLSDIFEFERFVYLNSL